MLGIEKGACGRLFYWINNKLSHKPEIKANSISIVDGETVVDVRGQTCPGYLLAINKAVEPLTTGTPVRILLTYPPGGEDVNAWCREKDVEFIGVTQENDMWVIQLKK